MASFIALFDQANFAAWTKPINFHNGFSGYRRLEVADVILFFQIFEFLPHQLEVAVIFLYFFLIL